jgi:hypothetical protein
LVPVFLLLLFFFGSVLAEPPLEEGPTQEALYLQKIEPALQERGLVAQARLDAAADFFRGDGMLGMAWPELEGEPLNSPAYLGAQLHQLQKRAEARAEDRRAAASDDIPAGLRQRRQEVLGNALLLEEREDMEKSRLLTALLVGIRAHPQLGSNALDAHFSRLSALREGLREDKEEDLALATSVYGQEKRLRETILAAVHSMGLGSPSPLVGFVEEELLHSPASMSTLERREQSRRLTLLLPLMDARTSEESGRRLSLLEKLLVSEELRELRAELLELDSLEDYPEGLDWAAERARLLKERDSLALLSPDSKGLEGDRVALQLQVAERRLALVEERLAVAEVLDSREIEENLASAQQKRAQAEQLQQETDEKDEQAIIGEIVELRKEVERLREEESERRKKATEALSALQLQAEALFDSSSSSQNLPPMDPNRQKSLDSGFLELHGLVRSLQSSIASIQAEIEINEERIGLHQRTSMVEQHDNAPPDLVGQRGDSISDLLGAYDDQHSHLVQELHAFVSLLRSVKTERRLLLYVSSSAATGESQRDFWAELAAEWTSLPIVVRSRGHELMLFLGSADRFSLQSIYSYFVVAIWGLGFFLLWLLVRRNAEHIMGWAIMRLRFVLSLHSSFQRPSRSAASQLPPEWVSIGQHGLDAFLLVLLSWFFQPRLPLLSVLFYIGAMVYLLRICLPMLRLILQEQESLDVEKTVQKKMLRSLQALIGWWMAFAALRVLAVQALDADRISDLISIFRNVALAAILFQLLRHWEPVISSSVQRHPERGILMRWKERFSDSIIGTRVKAILGLLILVRRLSGWGVALLIQGSGWIGSALARSSLQEQSIERPAVSAEVVERFRSSSRDDLLHYREEERIRAIYAGWQEDRSRGMIALIGDRGVGKSRIVERLPDILQTSGFMHFSLTDRLVKEESVQAMVNRWFGLEESADSRALVLHLRELEPKVIGIDDLHRLMLREVGGYEGMRWILGIFQATAHRHFWVASLHQHTWSFLFGAAAPINMDVFRASVRIGQLSSEEMSTWIKGRTTAAGVGLDFSPLASETEDPRTLRRIETAYWRLLSDESGGNPAVAESYFVESLSGSVSADAAILLFEAPDESRLEEITDTEVFTLSALLIHDGLSVELLERVLGIAQDELRSACRHLIGLEIIERSEKGYVVRMTWQPVVSRFLQQNRLLYTG